MNIYNKFEELRVLIINLFSSGAKVKFELTKCST